MLAPHLDDAVLSAWRVLSATHPKPTVITVFAGLPSDALKASHVAKRRLEDSLALGALGCRSVHLDHLEAAHRDGQHVNIAAVAADLGPYLARARELWAPLGIGRHADHLAVRQAVLLMLDSSPWLQLRLYADMPYALRDIGIPRYLNHKQAGNVHPRIGVKESAKRFSLLAPLWAFGIVNLQVIRLTHQETVEKLVSIQQYVSQFEMLGYGDRQLADGPVAEELARLEVHWRLETRLWARLIPKRAKGGRTCL